MDKLFSEKISIVFNNKCISGKSCFGKENCNKKDRFINDLNGMFNEECSQVRVKNL